LVHRPVDPGLIKVLVCSENVAFGEWLTHVPPLGEGPHRATIELELTNSLDGIGRGVCG